jgi:hypothetical protein
MQNSVGQGRDGAREQRVDPVEARLRQGAGHREYDEPEPNDGGSDTDDTVPIALPTLPLSLVMHQNVGDAPDDLSDHSPIVLPLKTLGATGYSRARGRRQRVAPRPPPRPTEWDWVDAVMAQAAVEDWMEATLEMQSTEHRHAMHLEWIATNQEEALLHEEVARAEEDQQQADRMEIYMEFSDHDF